MRCPHCDEKNIQGAEVCEECGQDLAGLDIPEAARGFAGRLMTDRVSDLSVSSPLTVPADSSVRDVVELLRREHHGCVLVEDGGALVGIFTERDVLTRIVRKGLDPGAVAVADVMTPEPYVLDAADPPAYAVHRMVVSGLRHLPVFDGTKLLGFISVRNVLRYIHDDVMAS